MRDLKFKITSWIVLAAGTLGFIPGFLPFRIGKILILEGAIFSGIAGWFIKNIWVQLFLIWCIIRVALGINKFSELTLHSLVFVLVIYQILANKLNKDRINTLLNIICVVAIIHSAVAILQYFGIWIIICPKGIDPKTAVFTIFPNTLYSIHIFGRQMSETVVGLLDNINTASALLGMCFPAFLRKKWYYTIPIVLIAFALIHSLGGILAALAAVLIFVIFKFGLKSLYAIIPTIGLFILYFIRFENLHNVFMSGSGRYGAWHFYITGLLAKRPIIGWGLGQSEFLWPIISKEVYQGGGPAWLHSHNEVITLAVELGIIGLILVAGYFITTFKNLRKKNIVVTCGLAACIISSLSIFSLHSAIGLLLIVYMAMAQYLITEKEPAGSIL
jgi:hypothetical protein